MVAKKYSIFVLGTRIPICKTYDRLIPLLNNFVFTVFFWFFKKRFERKCLK